MCFAASAKIANFEPQNLLNMKLDHIKGYLMAALAATAYGTNPAFAVPLYEQGMNPNSVLFFRYIIGIPLLALMLLWRGHSFSLRRDQVAPAVVLGVLMAFSSLSLFESYRYLNSGVASTLLFVYPVMVALLMMFFFHEKFKPSVALCLVLMGVGLVMLMKPQGDTTLSPFGCLLVMVSALTYAIYIVLVNVSSKVRDIPTVKLLLWVLASGAVTLAAMIPLGNPLTLPGEPAGWINLSSLAIISTVLSLACTTRAIQLIGSTPTAIFGALEPVSAVVLSVVVLGQAITMRDIAGGLLIVLATTLVVADKSVDKAILHIRKMFPRRPRH